MKIYITRESRVEEFYEGKRVVRVKVKIQRIKVL